MNLSSIWLIGCISKHLPKKKIVFRFKWILLFSLCQEYSIRSTLFVLFSIDCVFYLFMQLTRIQVSEMKQLCLRELYSFKFPSKNEKKKNPIFSVWSFIICANYEKQFCFFFVLFWVRIILSNSLCFLSITFIVCASRIYSITHKSIINTFRCQS